MSLNVRTYSPDDADAWDDFCGDSLQATLLHTRRFLSYHGDRFADRSLIIEEDGKWVGLFPAALSPGESTCVVSHPGITYGGILHQGGLRGERMINAFTEICRCYRVQGCVRLIYKAVPTFYHQALAQDDLYALFRLGALRTRCDLSSAIDLQHRFPVSERRRRSLKKAIKSGIEIVEGNQYLSALWGVLTYNLANKHGVKPVHTLEEIMMLSERFPANIRCVCGRLNEHVVAGVVVFVTPTAHHAQYIASSDEGYEISALDAILEHCIDAAVQRKMRWFDFGISNENQGMVLNEGLYKFKCEFGGGGAVHEFYELDLLVGD
ncbi:MAG: GNAT family N-acetyltransferase [Nitrosomonas sp.]|nr:GNAT family N-acetyltransferase [Nitrosomonas sp.]MBY0579313.1 GNAT family N-acetyltransferase [Burkholderiales bacterium]